MFVEIQKWVKSMFPVLFLSFFHPHISSYYFRVKFLTTQTAQHLDIAKAPSGCGGHIRISYFAPVSTLVYWASEASPTWVIHLGFFIYFYYYILLSYVRRGLCDPFFFFFGVHCAQYKVHAQCSFTALAPHMPCMLLVYVEGIWKCLLC